MLRKKSVVLIGLLLAGLGLTSVGWGFTRRKAVKQAVVKKEEAARGDKAEVKGLVKGNTEFAFDLYGRLRGQKGNLFYSPYSISVALAMIYAGAREETEKQMAETLHFSLEQDLLHKKFYGLQKRLNEEMKQEGVQLRVANALWIQNDYRILPTFLGLAKKYYGAGARAVDFRQAVEKARRQINGWVEEKTEEKIKDLIKPGVLNPMTRLVLTNAIYFKGDWAYPFKKKSTRPGRFYVTPEKTVEAALMRQKEKFLYGETEAAQILELPYAGKELSMVIVLPKKKDGLGELEKTLTGNRVQEWLKKGWVQEVVVFLPKFKMTREFNLSKTLAAMGMKDAFLPRQADFTGMTGEKDLFISAVVHKAFVEVNEEGTEAAAATGGVMGVTSVPAPPPVFRADHPFMFMIREVKTGSVLFMGRLVTP